MSSNGTVTNVSYYDVQFQQILLRPAALGVQQYSSPLNLVAFPVFPLDRLGISPLKRFIRQPKISLQLIKLGKVGLELYTRGGSEMGLLLQLSGRERYTIMSKINNCLLIDYAVIYTRKCKNQIVVTIRYRLNCHLQSYCFWCGQGTMIWETVRFQRIVRSKDIDHMPSLCIITWKYVAGNARQARLQEWNTHLVNDWTSEFGKVIWISGARRGADHSGWICQQWNTSGTSRW